MHPDTELPSSWQAAADRDDGMHPASPSGPAQSGELWLKLFGVPQAALDQRPLHVTRRATMALLAYLAVTRRSSTRSQLAALLASSPAQGQTLLRNTLSELRAHLGAHLRVVGQTVELDPALAVHTDVAAFEWAMAAGGEWRIARVQAAVEQCRGEFLEGLSLQEAYAFEEWQYFERERLHGLLVQALDELCVAHWRRGQLDSALAYGRRLIGAEPWHEGGHRAVMLLLLQLGQRAEALSHYAVCCRTLEAELGATPAPETEALYQRIVSASPAPHNLPPEPTPFIGRGQELATLARWLDEPECRVAAITGAGGVGKTRLALRAAARYVGGEPDISWLRFPDGVRLVALDGLRPDRYQPAAPSAERIFDAIGAALGLPRRSCGARVLAALRGRTLLLVLDNVEHLAGTGLVLDRITAHAPGVCLLITSHGAVPAAQRSLELGPLPLPSGPAALEQAEASQLFLQQARQAQLSFTPGAPERAAIVQICVAAGGMPLAIVQAAQLVRAMPCVGIAALLWERPLDLGSQLRNLPPRHQSLRANIAYSWSLLNQPQQLAVRRHVARAVAREVGGAGVPGGADAVAGLADVGLLIRGLGGAPAIPRLLHAFLAEQAGD